MYAIVKTGGKQYRVAAGDVISVEKLPAQVGDTVELSPIAIVDGAATQFDADAAAGTKVVAEVLEQYKGDKQIVFKFKKRKNYKRLNGHRQNLTRLHILSVGADEVASKLEEAAAEAVEDTVAAVEEAPVAEKAAEVAEEAVEAVEEAAAEVAEAAAETVSDAIEEVKEDAE